MSDETPLTAREVAERLRVNIETVRAWIRDEELKALDIGGEYRIFPSDLNEFIERRKKPRPRRKPKDDSQ